MKKLKKMKVHVNKIFSFISLLAMLANSFAPFVAMVPSRAYAEDTVPIEEVAQVETQTEEEASEEATTEETADGQDTAVEETNTEEIIPTETLDTQEGDILEDGVTDYRPIAEIEQDEAIEVTDIPTPLVDEGTVVTEEETVKEYETLSDGVEIKDSVDEDWNVDGEKSETKEIVKIGIKYIFPLEEDVSITFTKLPKLDEDRSTLKIERVKISDLNLPDDFNTDAEYAYDITTDMENGEFEYNLTLPKLEGSEAEVSYIEKSIEEAKEEVKSDDVKKVEEDKLDQEENEENVTVKDLDHFTIYVVETFSDSSLTISEDEFFIGARVYAKGTSSDNKWLRIRFKDASDNIVKTCDYSYGKEVDCSYDILPSDPVGTWSVELQRWNSHTEDTATFEVKNISVNVCNDPSDYYGLNSSIGIWTDVDGGSNVNGEGTNEVEWGNSTGFGQSGLSFDSVGVQTFDENTGFLLGTLTHMNWPITNAADGATLQIKLSFNDPAIFPDPTFDYYFDIEETPNNGSCAYGGNCNDKITFPTSYGNTIITIGDIQYTLVIDGFVDSYTCGSVGTVLNRFITEEQKDNVAYLVGHLSSVLIEQPAISIIKKTNDADITGAPGPDLTVGDAVTWQYVIQNTGNVDLTNISVTDNPSANIDCDPNIGGLQNSGLNLASGASMTCTATGTVTQGQYSNTATVTGNPVGGNTVSDSDTSWYTGVLPQTGSITIIKDTQPDDPDDITFHLSGPVSDLFNLDDDSDGTLSNTKTIIGLAAGTYTVLEEYVARRLTSSSITCSGSDSYGNLPVAPSATINLSAGENVTCTFVNTRNTGTITIDKVTNPTGDITDFNFNVSSIDTGVNQDLVLKDQDTPFSNLFATGVYTIEEKSLPTGWSLSNLVCNPSTGVTIDSNKATFDLDKDENITCTFTNNYIAPPICGDGIKNSDEDCDYGNLNDQFSCSSECTWIDACLPEMIANGSFEVPSVTDSSDWDIFSSSEVLGWTAEWYGGSGGGNDPQIELHAGVNGWTTSSDQYVELDSDWDGPGGGLNGEAASISIYQDIPTIPGNEYTLSWNYSPRPNHNNNRLEVKVNDTSVFDSGNIAGGGSVNWVTKSYTFIATTSLTTIRFTERGTADSYGMFLDDVSVECLGLPTTSVTVCKKDQHGNPLPGWKVGLSQPTGFDEEIPVTDGSGINALIDSGAFVVFTSGTYRYGNSAMIADAGFSYRPLGIPYGNDSWVSGEDLLSVPGALELKVDGQNINHWGAYNSSHQYSAYVPGFGGGNLNLAIWDDYYGDNVNNGDFRARVSKSIASSLTRENGCVTFTDIPYGDYEVFEVITQDGWSYQKTTVGSETITNYPANVTIGERVPEITITNHNSKLDQVTIVATKIVCDNESDLPNWGNGPSNNITEITAQRWVKAHPNCHLEEGWDFQWGDDSDFNPGDAVYGTAPGWNIFGPTGADGKATIEISDFGRTSQIKVREVLQEGYVPFTYTTSGNSNSNNVSAEIYCDTDVLNYDNDDRISNPQYGQTYYCVAFNALNIGSIHGFKWNDLNGDGEWRSCPVGDFGGDDSFIAQVGSLCFDELKLAGWEIFIDENGDSMWNDGEQKTTTSSNPDPAHFGWYVFEDLPLGTYRICEVQQNGWIQTTTPECHTVTLPDTNPMRLQVVLNMIEAPGYNFGNKVLPLSLLISESNDSSGTDLRIGDIIRFTLKLKVLEGPSFDTFIKQLLPNGFNFVGNVNAISTLQGNISLSDPNFHSPGVWDLGDLSAGEEVEISFDAEVATSVDPGIYKDLAFAFGEDVEENVVLAQSENPGIVNDTFVGTDMTVVEDPESLKDNVDVKETEEEEEVLGASTSMLPATGATTLWVKLAFIIASIGGLLLLLGGLGRMLKNRKIISVLLFLAAGIVFIPINNAYAGVLYPDPVIRIEEPESLVNSDFEITFVVMDTVTPERSMVARCMATNPGSSTPYQFGSDIDVTAGGNSYDCIVNSSVLGSDGMYKFYVEVDPTSGDPVDSDEVSVNYDGDAPGRPEYIEKDKKSDCENEIKIKTSDEGDTTYVQVYRDDDMEINIKDSNLIKTKTIGPDEKYTFTDEVYGSDCGKDYYYAVVAFDDAGNASKPRAEAVVTTVKITTESGEEIVEAMVVEGGTGIGGEEGQVASTEGETGTGEEGTENGGGSVLGEETEQIVGKSVLKSPWFWLALIGLGIIILSVLRKKNKKR